MSHNQNRELFVPTLIDQMDQAIEVKSLNGTGRHLDDQCRKCFERKAEIRLTFTVKDSGKQKYTTHLCRECMQDPKIILAMLNGGVE